MSARSPRRHIALLGAVAGLGAGDVLLGLNPGSLSPLPALRLVGGAGLVGLLLCAPFAVRTSTPARERPSRPFWLFVAAAGLALGLFAESQRVLYHAFLPNGSRRVLVASAFAGLLAGLVALAAVLRPPRESTSVRLLAVLAVLFGLAPFAGRRDSGPMAPLATADPVPGTTSRSLLVVGLEGVSWELLSQWASDGSLPTFARMMKEGVSGPLEQQRPYDRVALWTTAATGKRPAKHGLVGAVRYRTPLGTLRLLPRPFGLGTPERLPLSSTVPVPGSERRSLAFWEILAARGHQVAVLSWPGADPARSGLLLWATERLFSDAPGPVPGLPEETAQRAALFRAEPRTLEGSLVASLLPSGLPAADREAARPLAGAARDLSVTGAALAGVPVGPRSVVALVLSGLVPLAERFGPAAPGGPTHWGLEVPDNEARARALLAYYRFLDDVLADLLEREGRDRTFCVFAPAGWGPPAPLAAFSRFARGRPPVSVPDGSSGGFVILVGTGIRSAARLTTASVYDLAPTLLVLTGEPMARDFDGRVLAEAFDERFARSTSLPIVTTFEPGGPQ